MLCGGIANQNVNDLGELAQDADNYIRENVPELKEAKLVQFRSQVVSGSMYYFTYELNGVQTEAKAWSQPWLNNRLQVTLPGGQILLRGG